MVDVDIKVHQSQKVRSRRQHACSLSIIINPSAAYIRPTDLGQEDTRNLFRSNARDLEPPGLSAGPILQVVPCARRSATHSVWETWPTGTVLLLCFASQCLHAFRAGMPLILAEAIPCVLGDKPSKNPTCLSRGSSASFDAFLMVQGPSPTTRRFLISSEKSSPWAGYADVKCSRLTSARKTSSPSWHYLIRGIALSATVLQRDAGAMKSERPKKYCSWSLVMLSMFQGFVHPVPRSRTSSTQPWRSGSDG